jgi:translation initiation factor 4A
MENNSFSNNKDKPKESEIDKEEEQRLLTPNCEETIEKFEDLNLNKDLLRGIFGHGFVKPSVIQQKGISPILQGRDVVAQAQSGSGKTATFTIGILQLINPAEVKVQAMVLVPTRELADQINTVIQTIGKFMAIKIHLCIGGTNVGNDKKVLQDGVHIVVGTPGRVFDMMKREYLNVNYLRTLVLDEADEMLSKGFLDEINEIMKKIPSDCQICLFSATMPPEIIKMSEGIMTNAAKILVKNEDLTLKGIKQFYILCSDDNVKFDNMIEIFSNMEIVQCMIYCNKREKAEQVAQKMREKNFVCSCVHGKMKAEERNQIMQEFRSGQSRILISTDLLARGIDVHPVGLVINFELPQKKEEYIHRVGRTGRYGRRGVAVNLITKIEAKQLMDIEEHYSTQIAKMPDDLSEIDN